MSPHLGVIPSSSLLPDAAWRRSSRSTGMNNCVETASAPGGLQAVRDSKRVMLPALLFTPHAWRSFVGAVREEAL
ncbi:hypothetical protein GCM10010329_60190 [Streptomyces spiroverticillatus]|uniref:DUF397 domain-containing protein n=1 Tax=Streptomyces finlayi TaxID=67296 RepID=A0A918X3U4_9ACTN|nr:DUF397 domain-containing protein [Streptomyces finlayi]GHA28872.1 hypothetical protein GCM10010329_60190 [Streptomyces spiroverticillatus]GHD09481.1 hypothetical protein GCM10010334_63850 [Streptomyces finlayi]